MLALSWNRLTDITKNQKPYRGTTNRYPVGSRTQNTKNFYVDEIDGEKVYRITYGTHHIEHFVTKEVYEADTNKYHERTWETDEAKRYCFYEPVPNQLGVVRSDNTFEFTSKHGYGQGHNSVISSWSQGFFYCSSRHGGMVYRDNSRGIFHPIFKGMRMQIDTMQPHKDSIYKVVGKRVNRKEGKEFLKRYEDFYKINEVMLKAMDYKAYMETACDVVSSLEIPTDKWGLYDGERKKLITYAESCVNSAPLDAGVAFALAYDIKDIWSRVRASVGVGNSYYSREIELESIFINLKRKLNNELYRKNPTVMKQIEYEMGSLYPASQWGIDIYVDGKEVEQY
jgi:hypothetical protein